MTYFQAVFLAIVQGLTEFLPISSSGHLVIFQKLFGLKPPVLFDILVHVGTLGAILVYFKKELSQILQGLVKKQADSWRVVLMVMVGTIPAVFLGLLLRNYLEQIFNSLRLVGISLIITAGFLFSTQKFKKKSRHFSQLKWLDAFIIGIFQALAILPGISRSGSTIVSGLWRKLDQKTAFQFSFFLAIPAIIGALILQIPDLIIGNFNYLNQGIVGIFIAGVAGYFALKILESFLLKVKLWVFGIYCFVLGLLLVIF